MKTMFCLQIFLGLLGLQALADPVQTDGGGSTGGGNAINYKLIESYALPYSDWKDKAPFEKRLSWSEKHLPSLAAVIKEQKEKAVLYVIPASVHKLPKTKTGLPFKNQQCIVQVGHEIFWKQECYQKSGSEETAMSYFHELFMTKLKDKHSARVRSLVTKVFAPSPSVKEVQDTLARTGLGAHFTERQLATLRQDAKKLFLQSLNDQYLSAWSGGKPFPGCSSGTKLSLNLPLLNRTLLEQEIREGFLTSPAQRHPQDAPYFREGAAKTTVAWACERHVQDFSREFCQEHRAYTGARLKALASARGPSPAESASDIDAQPYFKELVRQAIPGESDLRFEASSAAETDLQKKIMADRISFLEDLSRNNDYLTILALNDLAGERRIYREDDTSKRFKALFSRVKARKNELARLSPAEKEKLLCVSFESLARRLLSKEGRKTLPSGNDPLEDTDLSQPVDSRIEPSAKGL